MATGTPEPATTVGAGRVGFAITAEAPTIDLIAKDNGSGGLDPDYTDTYGSSPAAAARLTLSIGLAENTDLELAAEGELWGFLIPIPTGASLGLRQHLVALDLFDIAVAGRVGAVGASNDDDTFNGTQSTSTHNSASAYYGALSAVVQWRHGVFRPALSINAMPFRIKRQIGGDVPDRFYGEATSATLGLLFVTKHITVGPYGALTNFESQEFKGAIFPSVGIMFAIRRDRDRDPRDYD